MNIVKNILMPSGAKWIICDECNGKGCPGCEYQKGWWSMPK